MLNRIKTVVSWIDEICFNISATVMMAVAVLSVFMRYVMHKPILWGEEVLMILILWSVFFGASVAIRDRAHVAVDILFDMFPRKIQMAMDAVIWWFVAYAITWIGKVQVDRSINLFKKAQTTVVLHFPKYVTYSVVTFACVLMLINHIIVGIEDIRKMRKELKGDSKE